MFIKNSPISSIPQAKTNDGCTLMIWITLLYFYDLVHYSMKHWKVRTKVSKQFVYELNNNQFISKLPFKVKYNIDRNYR